MWTAKISFEWFSKLLILLVGWLPKTDACIALLPFGSYVNSHHFRLWLSCVSEPVL
jgi:hypothetical protein